MEQESSTEESGDEKPCLDEEDLARALLDQHYDEANGKIMHEAFEGKHRSYSSLMVWALDRIITYFASKLHSPPSRYLKAYAVVNVGSLREAAKSYTHKSFPDGYDVDFYHRPEPDNPSHVQAEKKIPAGLARVIASRHIKDLKPIAPEIIDDLASQPEVGLEKRDIS